MEKLETIIMLVNDIKITKGVEVAEKGFKTPNEIIAEDIKEIKRLIKEYEKEFKEGIRHRG